MKQKARLEIQQNSDDGFIRLQIWSDNELTNTLDGIDNVYPAMEHLMQALREDYISHHRKKSSVKTVKPKLIVPE